MKNIFLTLLSFVFLLACDNQSSSDNSKNSTSIQDKEKVSKSKEFTTAVDFKYAEKIKVFESDTHYKIKIFGKEDLIQEKLIKKSDLPFSSYLSTSTTHVAFVNALDKADCLLGFPDPNLISDPYSHKRFTDKKIVDIGSFSSLDIEKIIDLQSDIFFDYPKGVTTQHPSKFKNLNTEVLLISEFYETEALAKAEWIKLFGVLFDQKQKADSIFSHVEQNYKRISSSLKQNVKIPKVISGIFFGDSWHAPAGESFTAKMFQLAGGDYIWKDIKGSGSLNLSFEKAFSDGLIADYWIGAGAKSSLKQLTIENEKYIHFKSFKNKMIYSSYGSVTPWGANPIFEQGVLRPDLILSDFYNIIHQSEDDLNFYKKLE
jgi:iron complex transport system substrate-binding protein